MSCDEPKKIYDLGVYATTATFSLFAYSWMYFCLELYTPDEVDVVEAWLTLFYFLLLVGLSFAADKYQQFKDKKALSEAEKAELHSQEEIKIKKSKLRYFAKRYGNQTVISIARGNGENNMITPDEQKLIIDTYKEVLGTEDLKEITAV